MAAIRVVSETRPVPEVKFGATPTTALPDGAKVLLAPLSLTTDQPAGAVVCVAVISLKLSEKLPLKFTGAAKAEERGEKSRCGAKAESNSKGGMFHDCRKRGRGLVGIEF